MASNSYLDNSGLAYFLTKLASWIPSWFPSQTGQSGKVLTTDGSSLSWTAQSGGEVLDGRISNCITYIPQDIKLELSGGTFTLKAGSKVYVPNGVGNFDVITIASDVGLKRGYSQTEFICYDSDRNILKAEKVSASYSGATAPTSDHYMFWYDTVNNKIKRSEDYGATWGNYAFSLPIAIATTNKTEYVSIDQVFNGFGYIGSTVFVLPNVKGLIPDGRNADGTLKTIPFVCTSVITRELTDTSTEDFAIQEGGSTIRQNSSYVLNEKENLLYTSAGTVEKNCVFARGQTSNGKILSLTPKTTFQAVDINDKTFVRLVETWRSSDGRLWYRKWSDGWIEQGGPMSTNENVTFHVAFSDTNYYVDVTWNGGKSEVFWPADWRITKSSNTYFTTTATTNAPNVHGLCWYACGY